MARKKSTVARREFLKGVVAGAGTLAAAVDPLGAKAAAPPAVAPRSIPPAPAIESDPPTDAEVLTIDRSGSDFMVDVHQVAGTSSTFAPIRVPVSAALHESVINYGGNKNPEFITCCHEESSVAMAPRLRQDRRQADGSLRARHGGPAARLDGASTTRTATACRFT